MQRTESSYFVINPLHKFVLPQVQKDSPFDQDFHTLRVWSTFNNSHQLLHPAAIVHPKDLIIQQNLNSNENCKSFSIVIFPINIKFFVIINPFSDLMLIQIKVSNMIIIFFYFLCSQAQVCNVFNAITTPDTPVRTIELNYNHELEIGIGIWTRFNPSVALYDRKMFEVEKMLIFQQTNSQNNELHMLYSIKFDQNTETMYHEVYLYMGENFQIISLPLNSKAVALTWVYFYICKALDDKYSVFIYYASNNEHIQMANGIRGYWKVTARYNFQIGHTATHSNQFNPKIIYSLEVFRGQISDLYLNNNIGSYFADIPSFLNFIENLVCLIPEKCQNKQVVTLLTPVTKFDGFQFLIKAYSREASRYLVSGWARAQALQSDYFYNSVLMRITTNYKYQDNSLSGDRVFYMQYRQHIQPELNGFYFSTFHSANLLNLEYQSQPDDIWLEQDPYYEFALAQWHFFTFQHGLTDPIQNTKLEIFFTYEQITKAKYFLAKNHLMDQKFYFFLGGDKYSQATGFKGELANVQFEYCFKTDQTPAIPCHHSCSQCLGPTKNDCNLCQNPSISNRQLISSTGECKCKKDFVEIDGVSNCQSETIEEIATNPNCKYGEFSVDLTFCLPCPLQHSSDSFGCGDCWENPWTWYLEPKCTFEYKIDSLDGNKNYNKSLKPLKDQVYYLIDKQTRLLEICEGCLFDYSSGTLVQCKPCYKKNDQGGCFKYLDNCLECNNQAQTCIRCVEKYVRTESGCVQCSPHCQECVFNSEQNRSYCTKCQKNYGLDEGSCTQCGQYCAICERVVQPSFTIMKCYSCEDPYQYYLAFDGENCRLNQVPDCLIAAQMRHNGKHFEASLNINYFPDKESNFQVICLRCKKGFINDHLQNKCLPSTNYDETIILDRGTYNLGINNQNPLLSQACSNQCSKCIKNFVFGQSFCLTCSYGYYSHKYSGICNLCPKYLNCKACEHYNSKYKDDWKLNVRADYYYFIGIGVGYPNYSQAADTTNRVDNQVLCRSCKSGYIYYEGYCIEGCDSTCKRCMAFDFKSICLECKHTLQGQLQSVENRVCLSCPHNCAFCRSYSSAEQKALNVYFDFSKDKYKHYSYQCLKPFNVPDLFYNWDISQYTACPNLKKVCDIKAKASFLVYCSDQMYLQAKMASANQEQFQKTNLKLSDVFNSYEYLSFPQIENDAFFEMMNQRQLRYLEISLNLVYDNFGTCKFTPISAAANVLKKNIFTLQQVSLEIVGNQNYELQLDSNITINHFDVVRFKDIQFILVSDTFVKIENYLDQQVYFDGIKMRQPQYVAVSIQFSIRNIKLLLIQNSIFQNMRVKNSQGVFLYEWMKISSKAFDLQVNNVKFITCNFLDTQIFVINLIDRVLSPQFRQNIKFIQINVQGSIFTNSTFLKVSKGANYGSASLQLSYLIFQNLRIFNSNLFQLTGIISELLQVSIEMSAFTDSKAFILEHFTFNNVKFTYNQIIQSQMVDSTNSEGIDQVNSFNSISFLFNHYTNGIAFIKYINAKSKLSIHELILQSNAILQSESLDSEQYVLAAFSLIYLEVKQLEVSKVSIIRGQGYPELAITLADKVTINNFYAGLDQVHFMETLHSSFDCVQKSIQYKQYPSLMYLYGIQTITITDMRLQRLISINLPLIQIQSLSKIVLIQQEQVTITESLFVDNVLIVTKTEIQQSIIFIESQQRQIINISGNKFQRNHQHSYFQDISYRSSSTISIQSPISTVYLANCLFDSCLNTNNKGSNLIIQAKEVLIQDSRFQNLNQITFQNVQSNLIWGSIESQYYEENLEEIFQIFSEGGAGYLSAQTVRFVNVIAKSTKALSGGGFFVQLKELGVVEMLSCVFLETHTSLDAQVSSYGGALFINSASAELTLLIEKTEFQQTFSRTQGGSLYISPSRLPIKVTITQTKIKNAYSLEGSFLYLAPPQIQHPDSLIITIQNSTVNNFDADSFFSNLRDLSNQELNQIGQSYLFQIYGGKITFQWNQIIAIQFNGLLRLQNFFSLLLNSISLSNHQLLSHPIISLSPYQYHNGTIKIFDSEFRSISMNPSDSRDLTAPQTVKKRQFYCLESVQKPQALVVFYTSLSKSSNSEFIRNQLKKIMKQIPAVFEIKQLTPEWFVQIQKLHFENIQCTSCVNGLLMISGARFVRGTNWINLSQLLFKYNQCGIEGCVKILQILDADNLRFLNQENLDKVYQENQIVEVRQSTFVQNVAQYGAGIYLKNIDALLINNFFSQNYAMKSGGAVYFSRSANNDTLLLVNTELTNNNASSGGALFVSDYNLNKPELLNVLFSGNQAFDYGSNLVQPPFSLTISLNKGVDLLNVTSLSTDLQARVDMVLTPKVYQSQILFPSGQRLNEYKYFNKSNQQYSDASLSLRVIPLNSQGQRMKQLSGTKCYLGSRLVALDDIHGLRAQPFSTEKINIKIVYFNESSQDYNLDTLMVKFSPELRTTSALQLQFTCDSVKIPIFDTSPPYLLKEYAMNYTLLLNVQTFYCQQGEYLRIENQTSLCEICDSQQEYYSVQPGEACKIKDQKTMKSVTPASVELREGYWRPNLNSIQIEYCRNLEENCLGGWKSGDDSCFLGHIGALCEQCDLYDIRGDGPYSTSSIYKCGSCSEVSGNLTKMLMISLWTMISIMMSVNSTLDANIISALGNKFKKIGIQVNPRSGISGILIKVFTNYMQILSTVATFQLKLPTALTSSISSVGSPMEAMSYSLDCFLLQLARDANIEIIYFRIIWGLVMPIFYLLIYFQIQGILVLIKFTKFNSGMISTAFVYMYIYLQPTIIGGVASLISFRRIAGLIWIQGNVSYRYDTQQHEFWLLYFLLPFLILFAVLIPLYMLAQLTVNRQRLDEFQIRQKWGYLYNEYTANSYFWEIVKIYQKSLIIIFLTFYEDVIIVKASMIFIIVFVYQLISKATNPYQVGYLNKFDEESSIICGLSIVMGITIYSALLTNNQEVIWPFYVILIFGNLIFIAKIMFSLIKVQIEQNQESLDKLRDQVNSKIPSLQKIKWLKVHLLQNRKQQQKRVQARFKKIRLFLKVQARGRIDLIKAFENIQITEKNIQSELRKNHVYKTGEISSPLASNVKENQDELNLKSSEFERFAIYRPINFVNATGNNSRNFEGLDQQPKIELKVGQPNQPADQPNHQPKKSQKLAKNLLNLSRVEKYQPLDRFGEENDEQTGDDKILQ